MVKFLKCFQTVLHISYLDGCSVGLRSVDGLQLLLKPWRIMSSCENTAKVLEQRCQGNHTHKNIDGIETPHSAYYPKPMCIISCESYYVRQHRMRSHGIYYTLTLVSTNLASLVFGFSCICFTSTIWDARSPISVHTCSRATNTHRG